MTSLGDFNDKPAQDRGRAVLIAGPTASGKSALALRLAREMGGVVINTDSMQVYRDLRVLTARPTAEEEAQVPHRLYGHRDAAINCSVGIWLDDALAVLRETRAAGQMPVFVGGSGLYFKALLRGLSNVPQVPAEVREDIRARMDRDGVETLHAELARVDPVSGAQLKPRDKARVARALEVIEATGKPIGEWHREGLPRVLSPENVTAIFLSPERDALYGRINRRFADMVGQGALDEVAALAARGLDPMLPAMKAHGVPALIRHLRGDMPLEEAMAIGCLDTRHYAKRQFTWFRHQLPEFQWVKPDDGYAALTHAGS